MGAVGENDRTETETTMRVNEECRQVDTAAAVDRAAFEARVLKDAAAPPRILVAPWGEVRSAAGAFVVDEEAVRETIAACETYSGYGARAVAIVSPFYYKLGPESVYAYFREIARASPIDVTLYNIPMFASPIDVPTVRRLAELERVVGIKDSSGDLAFMMRMISAVRPQRPDFSFLTGWDNVLVPMLLVA